MKLRTWTGLAAGVLAAFVLAAAAWLTPLRVPVLERAGRDFAVLRHQAERYRAELRLRPGDLAALEALRNTERRMATWRRSKEKSSVLGFAGWVVDLWPWLAFIGITFPAAGVLIASQRGGSGAASPTRLASTSRRPQASPPEAGVVPPPPPPMPSVPAIEPDPVPSPAPPPPAQEAPQPPEPHPFRPSASPADWNWSVRPAPRSPRAPKPFVEGEDWGKDPGAGT